MPRRWRDNCNCDERPIADAGGTPPLRPLSAPSPGNHPATGGGPRAPVSDSVGSAPQDEERQQELKQEKKKERERSRQLRQDGNEQATSSSARNVATVRERINVSDDVRGGNSNSATAATVAETETRTAEGDMRTSFAPSSTALTESTIGKPLPKQCLPVHPTAVSQKEGEMKLVEKALDVVSDAGSPGNTEDVGCGVTVERATSLAVACSGLLGSAPGGAVSTNVIESDRDIDDDVNRSVDAVGDGEEKDASKVESNKAAGSPAMAAARVGSQDEGDELTYSDCEDDCEGDSSAEAQKKNAVCKPIPSSNTTEVEGIFAAVTSTRGDGYARDARSTVDIDSGRYPHDQTGLLPPAVSPRAPESEGGKPRWPRPRFDGEDASVSGPLASGVIRENETIDVCGASEAAVEASYYRTEGAYTQREAADGVDMASTASGLREDGGGDPLIDFPGGLSTPLRGEVVSRGVKRGGLGGALSWSIGSSSFEATPLRGEEISVAFAGDTSVDSLASLPDADDVILAARALLGEMPTGADKTRINWLGRGDLDAVGTARGLGEISCDGSEAVHNTDPSLHRDTASSLFPPAARSDERQPARVSALGSSLKMVKPIGLSSSHGGLAVDARETARCFVDMPPERLALGLQHEGMDGEEQRRLAAMIGGDFKNLSDMSTRELEEELMWIRTVLKSCALP